VSPIRTAANGCDIKLSWSLPKDGGSPLTGMNFRVQDKKGNFVNLTDTKCGDNIAKKFVSCKISMKSLFEAPYNVDADKFIVI
jgi:hypothetical protein